MKLSALIEKRNAVINQRKRVELEGILENTWKDRPRDGFQSILTGVQRSRQGARRSAALEQNALHGKYLGGLVADIEKTGHFKLFATGAMDQDIARALWRADEESARFDDLMPEAVDVAKAIKKWQEISRLDANKEGANIGKESGYITRQSHDMHKIRKAGYEAWRDAILPKLNLERTVGTMGEKSLDQFLRKTYEGLASGVHLKADTAPSMTGIQGACESRAQSLTRARAALQEC
jgi:hypothetical protein